MKKWGVKNRKAGQWSRCGNIQFSLLSWELQREQKMTSLQRKKLCLLDNGRKLKFEKMQLLVQAASKLDMHRSRAQGFFFYQMWKNKHKACREPQSVSGWALNPFPLLEIESSGIILTILSVVTAVQEKRWWIFPVRVLWMEVLKQMLC